MRFDDTQLIQLLTRTKYVYVDLANVTGNPPTQFVRVQPSLIRLGHLLRNRRDARLREHEQQLVVRAIGDRSRLRTRCNVEHDGLPIATHVETQKDIVEARPTPGTGKTRLGGFRSWRWQFHDPWLTLDVQLFVVAERANHALAI